MGNFAVKFTYDVTCRATGRRSVIREMALYTMEGDRMVREEEFFTSPEWLQGVVTAG